MCLLLACRTPLKNQCLTEWIPCWNIILYNYNVNGHRLLKVLKIGIDRWKKDAQRHTSLDIVHNSVNCECKESREGVDFSSDLLILKSIALKTT